MRNKNILIFVLLILALANFVSAAPENLVVNLTFDEQTDPWKDASLYNHSFTAYNNISWSTGNDCKWYGCANMTSYVANDDYLLSNGVNFGNLTNGLSIEMWVYHTEGLSGSSSHGYFHMSNNTEQFWLDDTGHYIHSIGYGIASDFRLNNGSSAVTAGSWQSIVEGTWYHQVWIYDPDEARTYQYKDGVIYKNSSYSPDVGLTFQDNYEMAIGKKDSVNFGGYMDELLVWNSTLTADEILDRYNDKRQGTPPEIDVYVKDIIYHLPFNWSHQFNNLARGGEMQINITIGNAGTLAANNFNYNFTLAGEKICSNEVSIPASSEINVSCNWTTSEGFHKGNISLDNLNILSEDVESNNGQKVYVPFIDRPWFHFNKSYWDSDLYPYMTNPSNVVAYDSYEWASAFSCSGFNDGYDGNDVDPYGKKARECAMGCFVNNYTQPSKSQCDEAYRHLKGWANRTVTGYDNVQSIHELVHVGIAFDIMAPNLTEDDYYLVAGQLEDICQQISNLDNTKPYDDTDDVINGGNGFGFGSGMGGFCYSLIGADKDNPTLISKQDQKYYGSNLADEWMDRELRFLRAYKNDSWAKYQEGWAYKFYAQYHLVENWLFSNKYGLIDTSEYGNAFCGMAREMMTDTLDYNYFGDDLRNDESIYQRGIPRGDSSSYDDIGSGSFVGSSTLTYWAYLCGDVDVKEGMLWLRNFTHNAGDGDNKYIDLYLYKSVEGQVSSPKSPEVFMPKVAFDNANDILTMRSNYTYINDTVIQIDGGEERGGGHSQAQGFYLYALGEPFLEGEQVPYEDDTRHDTWKNGISLQNTTQADEGLGGTYNSVLGQYDYNQYYGGGNTMYYSTDYPNYRKFPLEYGGDLEDYVGTKNGDISGVFVWRPQGNSSDVHQYFIKFDDVLYEWFVTNQNNEGQVYHNFINMYDEFTQTHNSENITYQRTKFDGSVVSLDINVLNSNVTFTVGGGNTSLQACYGKTDCSGSYRANSSYRRDYLYTPNSDVNTLISMHWYDSGKKNTPSDITTVAGDYGAKQGDNYIYVDSNKDGVINSSGNSARGWGLIFDDNRIGAFNTTEIINGTRRIFTSNATTSVIIEQSTSTIVVTGNTMERSPSIDVSQNINVTIDVSELDEGSGFSVLKNGVDSVTSTESGTLVSFVMSTEQNSDYFVITGSGPDTTPPSITLSNVSTDNQSILMRVSTNENANTTLTYGTCPSFTDLGTLKNSTVQSSVDFSILGLGNNSLICFNATSEDAANNSDSNNISVLTAQNAALDLTSPVITLLKNESTTNISTYISWTCDENCNYSLYVYNDSDRSILVFSIDNNTFDTTHKQYVAGMINFTTHYVNLTVSDSSGNVAQNNSLTFTTAQNAPPTPDIINPIIYNITVSGISTSAATINVNASESINLSIAYGTDKDLSSTDTEPSFLSYNSIILSSLTASQLYYYNVTSCDSSGNCVINGTFNFTTSSEAAVVVGGGGGGGGRITEEEEINESLEVCIQKEDLLSRLFDDCIIEDGICSDAEHPLSNEDCSITMESLSCQGERCIFQELWVAKLGIITFAFYRIRKRKKERK